ncbi:MAG TPA: carbon monoxide dehydrogenase subunit G [Kiloniellaceae bacterium]|nr:carbon monoxide dehydrogenase subunit G [Kiloniellaceae bacterium]
MEMTGSERIAAPRERVYQALNDPEILKAAIPGCESIEKLSDTEMTATVVTKVGPVKAKFAGAVTLADLDPPRGYTIRGEGKGGAAGFAKGGAKVRLEEDGGATVLHYEVKADVGGKLAQLGSRLIDGTAKKLSGEFFTRFAAIVAGQEEGAAPPAPGAAAEAQTVAPPQAVPAAPASRALVWIGALVVAAALLVGYILVAG